RTESRRSPPPPCSARRRPNPIRSSDACPTPADSSTPDDHPLVAGEIAQDLCAPKPASADQLGDSRRLIGTDLQRNQLHARPLAQKRCQPADRVQPVRAREQRRGGLIARDLS